MLKCPDILVFQVVPIIFYHFLNESRTPDFLFEGFERILDSGKKFFLNLFMSSMKTLQEWSENSREVSESFKENFSQLSQRISIDQVLKAQIITEDHKGTLKSIETKLMSDPLDKRTPSNKIPFEHYWNFFSSMCQVCPDMKSIDPDASLRKLYKNIPLEGKNFFKKEDSKLMWMLEKEIPANFFIRSKSAPELELLYDQMKSAFLNPSSNTAKLYMAMLLWLVQELFEHKEIQMESNKTIRRIQIVLQNLKIGTMLNLLNFKMNHDSTFWVVHYLELFIRMEEVISVCFPQTFKRETSKLKRMSHPLVKKLRSHGEIEENSFEIISNYAKILHQKRIERSSPFQSSLGEESDYFWKAKEIEEALTVVQILEPMMKTLENVDDYEINKFYLSVVTSIIRIASKNPGGTSDKVVFQILHEVIHSSIKLNYKKGGKKGMEQASKYCDEFLENEKCFFDPDPTYLLISKVRSATKGSISALDILEKRSFNNRIAEMKSFFLRTKFMEQNYDFESIKAFSNNKILPLGVFQRQRTQDPIICEEIFYQMGRILERGLNKLELIDHFKVVKSFLRSISYGHKFLYRSLPRLLRIFLGALEKFHKEVSPHAHGYKIFLEKEISEIINWLKTIEPWKLLCVQQLLLSRVSKAGNDAIYEFVLSLLKTIATTYPKQVVFISGNLDILPFLERLVADSFGLFRRK